MATAAFLEGAPGGADYGLAQGFGSFQVVERPGAEGLLWMADHAEEDFLLVMAGWGSRALDEVDLLLDEEQAIDPERVAEVLASRDSDDPRLFDGAELARVKDWYAARVQVMDAFIGDFMAAFETAGLDERATLVVLGSNGFALQEHDDLFGETVYAPSTRVPLFVRFPGGAKVETVDTVVEVIDLMPTLAELAGLAPSAAVQGASLIPVIEETATPPYVAFGETQTGAGQRYVALAGYRAVATGGDGGIELFHTAVDPLELEDLAEAEPDKLTKLSNDLDAWSKMITATSLDPELRSDAELDDETLKQLKSLGYIQ
jgi:arylsulfatase A-like enzyme